MYKKITILLVFCLILFGCTTNKTYPTPVDKTPSPIREEIKFPEAPEIDIETDNKTAVIDYSHLSKGYVSVKALDTSVKLKLAISKADEVYYYDLDTLDYMSYPLQMGDGHYQFRILRLIQSEDYAIMFSKDVNVTLENEFTPFLYPNKIIHYTKDSNVIDKAYELTLTDQTVLERVKHIFEYVTENVKYDDNKVEEVQGKFVLPIVDETLETNKGICFDYAALVTAMYRSLNIPTKLYTGYTSKEYHAWVEVYVDKEGWINPHVLFEENKWTRLDPTYSAQGQYYKGEYINRYIY